MQIHGRLALLLILGLLRIGLMSADTRADFLTDSEDRLAAVRLGLQQLALDPTRIYRVRELALAEGGVKFYLTEGVLAFATPVGGQRVAAIYTTAPVEAGDAEVIALPPIPAERASLARFTKSPNLDEHFSTALLFFANSTADDLLRQIQTRPVHAAPELADALGTKFNDSLRRSAAEIEVRIAQSILDRHALRNSFFYGMVAGRTLGTVDFIYQPKEPDTLVFGRVANRSEDDEAARGAYFQIWSAFRPATSQAASQLEPPPVYQIRDYHIDATIHSDLSMTATADFDYEADSDDGSVISLLLTPRLRVTAASIDGVAAGVLMNDSPRATDFRGALNFLVVNGRELAPGSHHRVRIQYAGTVIRRTARGAYFVDDRNAWYPVTMPMLTSFDLTFRCPENLRLVATGEPVSEDVANGERVVHRRTARAQALAGFNLGEFDIAQSEHAPYQILICSNRQEAALPKLDEQAAQILHYFSERWMPLTGHSISIAPIEGYFGQGFPGLIYLSNISYLREKDRPQDLRNASFDSFFSRLLLPHELAHQWWGNVVTPADYRSNWIVEAMANYAALQYLEKVHGRQAMDSILADYRADLTKVRTQGELVDSYGPVTFDQRLENNFGSKIWHDVLYEKGTWIFHMLRERMGEKSFHDFQLKLLQDFASRPISNEDLRQAAAGFIPANQPDRRLTSFFDTWINDTGIPILSSQGTSIRMTGVSEHYSLDVPLNCPGGETKWVRMDNGEGLDVNRKCALPPVTNFLYKK